MKRNLYISVVSFILLSLITCGIYTLAWIVFTTNKVEYIIKDKNGALPSGGVCLLLSIITCGIYSWFWIYKMCERIAILRKESGLYYKNDNVLCLILAIFSLSIVSYAIMQNSLNEISETSDDNQMNNNNYSNSSNNNNNSNNSNNNNSNYDEF